MPHDHPSHDHAHQGHNHSPEVSSDNESRIRLVFALTAGYAVIQAIGGWVAGSLALIADSGHMISDAAALLLALFAYRIARKPADLARSYGYGRVRVLAALFNGASLLVLIVWITFEAVSRISQPTEVMASPMLIIAIIGLIVNIIGAFILQSGQHNDANLRGAYLHVLGDLLGSIGAIAAAIGIMLTGWTLLDPILSVFVALLVLRSAWGLVRQSLGVLLQSTPAGIDPSRVINGILALEGVAQVGHLHLWAVNDAEVVATLHASASSGTDPLLLPGRISQWLKSEFSITHVTVQIDPPGTIDQHH